MLYVRITSYLDGKLMAEHYYFGNNQIDAISRFRAEYPEHADCIVCAETIDSEDPHWQELFSVARRCGCTHCF